MKPIYNNDDLEKYRQVNGILNDEGQRIFCNRINAYLDQKDKDKDKEIERLNKRFDAIKDYLKQIREENQKGILSSYNLIEDNIIRLCDGEKLKGSDK